MNQEETLNYLDEKVDWNYLDEKVDWNYISYSQDLSDKFINKYRDRLNMEKVNKRRNKRIRETIENALYNEGKYNE